MVTHALVALALVLAPLPQTGRGEKALASFKREREKVLIHCGQRHLEYGLELRRKGLSILAATQIVLSVDASEGRNETSKMILGLMRTFEDAFWKRRARAPSSKALAAYERKARKLRLQDQSDRLDLARKAERKKLEEQAYREVREVLLAVDEPLVFDDKGALVLEGGKFRGPVAERVRTSAIEINGQLYARDSFLQRVPQIQSLYELTTARLRVRSTSSESEARDLHAACAALLPVLDAEMGVTPERRLQVVVLGERKTYNTYLDISGLSSHRAADGFADRLAGAAVLCSEGSTPEFVLGLALHELTHLHQLCVSPAAFPSWYMEGSAEAHGGQGTFRWDGTALETRGTMAAVRLDEIRSKRLPLRELLDADALSLLASDGQAARRFYAEAWAFLRFLEEGAGDKIAAKLARWRAMCLGSILGADLFKAYAMDASASRELFLELFEEDMERLEKQFGVWLEAR